jgi:hypothetical protein
VDHFDIMARSRFTNPVAAWLAVRLGSCLLEDLLDGGPSRGRASRHERWAITSAFLAARDSSTYKKEAFGFKILGSADRVWVVRIATVNNDIALFQVRFEQFNKVVDGGSSFDEEKYFAGFFEFGTELLDFGTLYFGACCCFDESRRSCREVKEHCGPFASFARK